jgi:hypothetical protein
LPNAVDAAAVVSEPEDVEDVSHARIVAAATSAPMSERVIAILFVVIFTESMD